MKTEAQVRRMKYLISRYRSVLSDMDKDENDIHHGTLFGYNAGCRCKKCVEHQSAYRKARRKCGLQK